MAIKRKLYSDVSYNQVIDPATVTADTDSASVDTQDYSDVLFLVNVGESGDTLDASNYIELEVEESDDNVTFTDVADEDLNAYVAGTNDGTFALVDASDEDDAVYFTGYTGIKRYVRVVVNVTGTHTNGTPVAASILMSGSRVGAVNTSTDS